MISRRTFVQGLVHGVGGGAILLGGARAGWASVPSPAVLTGPEFDLTIGEARVNFTGATRRAVVVNGQLPAPLLRMRQGDTVTVRVTNTGTRPCREVVQLYAHDPVADVTRPEVELLAWRAVDISPGQSVDVDFPVTAADFAYTGADLAERVDTGEVVLLTGPDAATLRPVTLTVTA